VTKQRFDPVSILSAPFGNSQLACVVGGRALDSQSPSRIQPLLVAAALLMQ